MSDFEGISIKSGLSNLTSSVCSESIREEYREKLTIDPSNINQCCIDQPLLIQEIISLYEIAYAESEALKDSLSLAYATLDPQARLLLESTGKITEGKVDACIKSFPAYVDLQNKYHAAKENAGLWKALVEAARQRKDMLVTIASNYRSEGHSDFSVRNTDSLDLLKSKARAILSQSGE